MGGEGAKFLVFVRDRRPLDGLPRRRLLKTRLNPPLVSNEAVGFSLEGGGELGQTGMWGIKNSVEVTVVPLKEIVGAVVPVNQKFEYLS